MTLRYPVIVVSLLVCTSIARGYAVGRPVELEKLTLDSDIVFKGTVVSSGPVQDESFKSYPAFSVFETQFEVISVLKGDKPGSALRFHHYDESPTKWGANFQPQYYHFQSNKTYIVFGKTTEQVGVYRQIWTYHTGKEDQGVVLCADDRLLFAPTVKETIWDELVVMLKSHSVSNVIYAIRQLDQMSGGENEYSGTKDFNRKDVAAAVHGFMVDGDSGIACTAIPVVGSHNPYLSEESAPFWLATVGSAGLRGFGKMDPKMQNAGGELYWRDLVVIADSKTPAYTRALAIRALGLVREPSLHGAIDRWLIDKEPTVRASAILLLADSLDTNSIQEFVDLSSDTAPKVRACVAYAIGFAQQAEAIGVLEKLLADKDTTVRKAAAMSLLSFSPKQEAVAQAFRQNLDDVEFKPLFLNALAQENPELYLEGLANAVEEKIEPQNWWGGQIPAFAAWEILFKYLQAQPVDVVRSGKVDRYLDAMEKVGNYSSSEPCDIYAFYLQRGMKDRAKQYREMAKKAVHYDLDYYFKQVDRNPSAYQRE